MYKHNTALGLQIRSMFLKINENLSSSMSFKIGFATVFHAVGGLGPCTAKGGQSWVNLGCKGMRGVSLRLPLHSRVCFLIT